MDSDYKPVTPQCVNKNNSQEEWQCFFTWIRAIIYKIQKVNTYVDWQLTSHFTLGLRVDIFLRLGLITGSVIRNVTALNIHPYFAMPEKNHANGVPVLLGFAREVRLENGRLRLKFNWGRISILVACLLVMGWFALGGVVFGWYKFKRGYEDITYFQALAFPIKNDEIRRSMGDYYIEQAEKALEEGNYREASMLSRIGLERSPKNLMGRTIVAEFEMAMGQSDSATKLLYDGLAYATEEDTDYWAKTLRYFLSLRADQQILDIASKYLPETADITQRNALIAMAAAQANVYRGNFDTAENLIHSYDLDQKIDGVLLLAQIYWSRDQRTAAIERLEAFINRPKSEALDPIYAVLARFCRDADMEDKALRYTVARTTLNPFSADPRIELLYFYHKRGELDRMDREAEAIIQQFRRESNAMMRLANFATDIGDIPMARRVYEIALENNFSVASFGMLYIEAHLVAKRYTEAIDLCNDLVKENPTWLAQFEPTFNSLRSLSYFAAGNTDLGSLYLGRFTESRNVRVDTLISVAYRFKQIGMLDAARAILVSAYQRDSKNQVALSGIIEIDLDQGYSRDLATNLRNLLLLRRPSYELLRRAYRELNSDRFIFTTQRSELLVDLSTVIREVTPESTPDGRAAL